MMLGTATNNWRALGLIVFMLASLLGLPPIVQDQNYHDFADQRTLFGIPHFWNVISNIPFIGIGAGWLKALRLGAILSMRCAATNLLFAPRFSGTIYWLIAAMLYALAKLFEFYDSDLFCRYDSEWAYPQARLCGSRVRRAPEIFSKTHADNDSECS
jgi:hypothetical protein